MYGSLKRLLDFAFSLILIIFLSPVLFAIASIIFIFSGRPIIFRQKRAGLNGRSFSTYKFRTMIPNASEFQKKGVKEDLLITREGNLLRLLHLDELPQLFNILKGQMSFVGPRPLVFDEYKHYVKNKKKYAEIYNNTPGLTGMNSTLGYLSTKKRRKIMKKLGLKYSSFKMLHGKMSRQYMRKKLERELYYLKNKSFFLDMRIICWTFLVLLQNLGKALHLKKR